MAKYLFVLIGFTLAACSNSGSAPQGRGTFDPHTYGGAFGQLLGWPAQVAVWDAQGNEIIHFTTDSHGNASLSLPVGSYIWGLSDTTQRIARQPISVATGQVTRDTLDVRPWCV